LPPEGAVPLMNSVRDWETLAPGQVEATSGLVLTSQKTASESILVQETLQSILHSPLFRGSHQCSELLRYVVEQSLSGHDNLLRERVIGAAVFGRAPDYDTANDPIVRARMAEVRKRLAQYYQSANPNASLVRIEVMLGHYRAHFHFPSKQAPAAPESRELATAHIEDREQVAVLSPIIPNTILPEPEPRPSRFRTGLAVAAAILGLVAVCGVVLSVRGLRPGKETAFDQFWMPALKSPMPVMVYAGTNVVYRFSPEFLEHYRQTHHLQNDGPEIEVDLKSVGPLQAGDLTVSDNSYVTTGDVTAFAAVTSMLVQNKKPYQLRYAGDISPGDFHSAPTVLIGAFNNAWTLNVTNPLRFTFASGDTIRDRFDASHFWKVGVGPHGSTTDDYAIVSRILSTDRRETIMTAAGIGEYGTQAASEFLSSPQKIADFARNAPAGWDKKNFQIVMHIKVADEAPASEEIVATYYW
jgi:hypothetical protein